MIAGKFPDKSTGKNPRMSFGAGSGHIPSMALSSKIKKLMQEKGLNPYSTAVKAELTEDAVRDIVRGKTKDPGASKLLAIARVLETSVEDLFSDDDLGPSLVRPGQVQGPAEIMLPVAYRCAAGNFREVDETSQVEPRLEPAEYFPTYARWPQWLEEVEGDSIDKLIPDGALIHVVDTQAMGYAPVQGDIVVVERTRLGGLLRERTVKQIEISGAGVQLWPRSHNPAYQSPLKLSVGVAEGSDVQVTIVGKVLQAYIRFGKR